MGWFDKITEPEVAPSPSAAPPTGQRQSYFDQLTSQTIGPAERLPQPIEDAARMAPMATQVGASLPKDEMAKVKYYASKRFPGIPIEAALDRYSWKDDRLAYTGGDGKSYFEEPTARVPRTINDLSQDAKVLAAGVGPAMPVVGGGIGGVLSMGVGGGIPGAGAGGMIGDAIRQGLAATVTDETKPLGARALQNVGAGAEQAAGQAIGLGFGKMLPHRTPTFNIPDVTRTGDAARRLGIRLTAGEETGNRELIRRQKILANTTQADETFENFYTGRNEDVGNAVNGLLNQLSPKQGPRAAAGAGVEGAQAALKKSNEDLQALARPSYKKALDDRTDRFWSPEVEDLMRRPSMAKAIGHAQKVAAERGETITVPTFENGNRVKDEIVPDWRSWDSIKKSLYAIEKENTDQFGRLTDYGRAVKDTRRDLLAKLDKANPDYKTARGIFEDGVPARTELETGVTGDISKLENNDVLRAGNIVFGKGSSDYDVRLAREAFKKAGKIDEWNALVKSHLEGIFNDIPESATGSVVNLGGSFAKAIYGKQWKKANIDAAIEHLPGFQRDFADLITVLNATGKAMKGESISVFAYAGQKELANEAKGIIPSAIETIEIWRSPSRFANYIADIQTGKYNARMAELLTTPAGRTQLKELRKLSPGSARAVVALSQILTTGGLSAVGNAVSSDKNGPVSTPRGQ